MHDARCQPGPTARFGSLPFGSRSRLVRRGARGTLQLLNVVRSQFRRIDRDGHLVDGAGEFERYLVVSIQP